VPLRDGLGSVIGAVNVNAHAAETSVRKLTEEHLPLLLRTASAISTDWALYEAVPHVTAS
jgi:IclR family pca regulon transcriptional regulator